MYTHICVSADDLEASSNFYEAALAPLGVNKVGQFNERSVGFSNGQGMLLVMKPADGNAPSFANGGTIGFAAETKEAVDAFHAGGVANGGSDEGAPGVRLNAPGNAYGAYLRDPVGNKICAFAQLPE